MANHALILLQEIDQHLNESAPLPNGWHSTPIDVKTGTWGNFYIPSSTIARSMCGTRDFNHRGVINIFDRSSEKQKPNPVRIYQSAQSVFEALESFTIETPEFWLNSFVPNQINPTLRDELTWQGTITFTAITREVQNG